MTETETTETPIRLDEIEQHINNATAQEKAEAMKRYRECVFVLADKGELNPAQTETLCAVMKVLEFAPGRPKADAQIIREAKRLQKLADEVFDMDALRSNFAKASAAACEAACEEIADYFRQAPLLENIVGAMPKIRANCPWMRTSHPGLPNRNVSSLVASVKTAQAALDKANNSPILADQAVNRLKYENPDLWDRQ